MLGNAINNVCDSQANVHATIRAATLANVQALFPLKSIQTSSRC